jgi:catechol 2,3-dioxygenase-like lactoylglutathione lyase family enzyme
MVSDVDFEFVAGFGPIGVDPDATHTFWATTLGIPLQEDQDTPGYFHTFNLGGTKAFALWPLAQAAEATFGTSEWPDDRPVPQAWIEFEVSSPEAVADTAARLRASGQELLQDAHQDPWGQTTARLLSPEGLLVGISYLPRFH